MIASGRRNGLSPSERAAALRRSETGCSGRGSSGYGVLRHGSALEVWELSDWVPHHAEMTLPSSWKQRMISKRVLAFFDDLPSEDVQWYEGFRVTTPRRSVDDFITWGIRPDLARQALERGKSRSRPGGALFHKRDLMNLHKLIQ